MKKIIVVINGSGGVGKDSFVNCLKEFNLKILNISTIDRIKEIVEELAPCYSYGKSEKYRRFLSDLKDAFTTFNDLPYEDCRKKIDNNDFDIAFIHCREPKEIQKFVDRMGATTLLITNDNVPHIETNHADSEVYNFNYKYKIDNSGTLEELKEKAIEFYNKLKN